jgi:tol-pal system protein YbgF
MRRATSTAGPAVALLTALLLAGGAQGREASPTEIKLNDIDTRLGRVEAVVNNQSLLDMARRIDELEAQLRQLRGAQEETQNGADSLGKQQRDLYADLDRRLTALEVSVRSARSSMAGSASPAPGGSPDPAVNVASAAGDAGSLAPTDDQVAYNHAFDTLKSGSYFAAIAQWLDFLKTYSSSKLQDNAQYWLGESYYVTRDFDNASLVFKGLVDRYPDSAKAPDALLKLGYCQYEKKRLPDARATLKLVQTRYPDSDAARLAGERLAKIDAAGGAATR